MVQGQVLGGPDLAKIFPQLLYVLQSVDDTDVLEEDGETSSREALANQPEPADIALQLSSDLHQEFKREGLHNGDMLRETHEFAALRCF